MKLFGAFVPGPSKQCPSDPLIAQLRLRHGRCDLRDCRSLSAFIVAHAGRSVVAKLCNILITGILRAPYRPLETTRTLRLLMAVMADIQTKLKRIVTLAKANNSISHGICEIEFAGMIVPGDHGTMIKWPAVELVAARLRQETLNAKQIRKL